MNNASVGKWTAVALAVIALLAVGYFGTVLLLSLAEAMMERIALDIVCRSLVEAKLVGSCGPK